MADKAVSELIEAERITATDLFVLEQNGTAKKLSGQVLLNWLTAAADGHGGIQSISKIKTEGLADTYQITLADTTKIDFVVTNGRGISSIAKKSTSGLVDTYAITYNDGTTGTFTVTNGAKGEKGDNQYVWIKYASKEPTASSHSFGDLPDNWIGIYSGASDTAPTAWTEYQWFQIKGEKGDAGEPAKLTSFVVEYQVSDSGTIVPSGAWSQSVPVVPQGKYLWTRTTNTFNTGNPVVAYSVSRMGLDGSGSVSSVANISPDANGNVPLTAENVGAVPSGGGDMTGELQMNGQPISGLNMPTENDQAANMGFVNQQVKKAAPRNALDNSYFTNPVNQRGQTSYTGAVYGIDRWIAGGGNSEVLVGQSGVTIVSDSSANGLLNQRIDYNLSKSLYGKVCTVAFCEDNGAITIASGVFSANDVSATTKLFGAKSANGDYDIEVHKFGNTQNFNVRVRLNPGVQKTFVWAALYEGEFTLETLPAYQPKGYGAELAECQRYYVRFASTSDMIAFSGGSNNQYGYFLISIPVPMRSGVVPTVNYKTIDIYGLTAGSAVDITDIICYFTNFNNALMLRVTHAKSAFESQTPVMLRIKANGYIELVAEL